MVREQMQQILEPLCSLIEHLVLHLSKSYGLIAQVHRLAKWEEFGKKSIKDPILSGDRPKRQ